MHFFNFQNQPIKAKKSVQTVLYSPLLYFKIFTFKNHTHNFPPTKSHTMKASQSHLASWMMETNRIWMNPGYFLYFCQLSCNRNLFASFCALRGAGGWHRTQRPVHQVWARESSSLSSCFQSLRGTDGDLPPVLLCFQGRPALTRARVAARASRYPAHACSLSPQTETMTARAHATHTLSPPPSLTPPSWCAVATQNSMNKRGWERDDR